MSAHIELSDDESSSTGDKFTIVDVENAANFFAGLHSYFSLAEAVDIWGVRGGHAQFKLYQSLNCDEFSFFTTLGETNQERVIKWYNDKVTEKYRVDYESVEEVLDIFHMIAGYVGKICRSLWPDDISHYARRYYEVSGGVSTRFYQNLDRRNRAKVYLWYLENFTL